MTTDTYSYSCRCGTKSPRFSAREARTDWHAVHVHEGCPARRAKPGHQLDWDDPREATRARSPAAADRAGDELGVAREHAHSPRLEPRRPGMPEWDPQRRDLG